MDCRMSQADTLKHHVVDLLSRADAAIVNNYSAAAIGMKSIRSHD